MNKKPIINLKSNLFEKINYKTDHYNKYLKLKGLLSSLPLYSILGIFLK